MEIIITIDVREKDEYGRVPSFRLLRFYPGAMQKKSISKGNCWLEWMDDKSVLPVDCLMEEPLR